MTVATKNKVKGAVGSSPTRTPAKHALLNKIVGRESGVARHGRYVQIDLCAGDGRDDVHSGTSSPSIMLRHRDYAAARGWGDRPVILNEINESTHQALRSNVSGRGAIVLPRGDARTPGQIPVTWGPHDFVFVHNDPNKVTDFALSADLVGGLPEMTTVMSTLGCNVSGLLRTDIEERREWYGLISLQASLMQRWHDMLLVSLWMDEARWAYLINTPRKWRSRVEENVSEAFDGVWQKGVRTAWLRTEPAQFRELADYHFLTNGERGR